MVRYGYYVVESSFVVRMGGGRTERLTADGCWVDYPDTRDVIMNGRKVKGGEAEALVAAKAIFDKQRLREAGARAMDTYRAKGPSRAVSEFLEPGAATGDSSRVVGRSARVSVMTCHPVVPDGADAVETRICPDGRRVAVVWVRGDEAGIDLGGMGGGGDWHPLVKQGKERPSELTWSPEGAHVAYLSAIQDYVAWIDTATPLTEQVRVYGTAFAWRSGDQGLYVACAPYADIAWHDVSTGERQPLAYYHTYLPEDFRARVLLSPLGNHLAFTTEEVRDDASWVYVFNLETEELRVVTRIPGAKAHVLPCWAPDGDSLGVYVVHGPCNRTGLLVHKLSDETEELFYRSEGAGGAFTPAWSPDGRSIAFFGDNTLLLLDVETRSLHRLCEPGLVLGDLHFIDENHLAVDGGGVARVVALC